jgi:hypothetical protein
MELLIELLEALDGAIEAELPAAPLPRPGAHLPSTMQIPQHTSNSSGKSASSRGGTRTPWTPSSITSGIPPTRVATIGLPASMNSRIVSGLP